MHLSATLIVSLQIKQSENEAALSQLQYRLEYLDSLQPYQQQVELAIGMLAGNMFDWGAKAVIDMMKQEGFGLTEAIRKIPGEPLSLPSIFFIEKVFFLCLWFIF